MTPRPYQIPGIQKAVATLPKYGAYLLADDMGAGKSYSTAFIVRELGWPVAVVCPKSVIPTWKQVFSSLGITPLFIENPERLMARQEWGVKNPSKDRRWEWRLPSRCLLVFDELHRHTGEDSILSHMFAFSPKPVLGLSATAADKIEKLRPILHMFGISRWDDWNNFLVKSGMQFNRFSGGWYLSNESMYERSMKRVHKALFQEKGSRVRIADLGNAFPDNQVETVLVPVEDAKGIDKEYLEMLEQMELEAESSLVAGLRARQIAEHQKLPAIREMTQDMLDQGISVALFVCFKDSLHRLKEWFPEASVVIGDQTAEERQQDIERFQGNQTKVIICTLSAGSASISLHDLEGGNPRASLICPSFSALELRQALGRIHRNGGKTPCIQKILFAEGTIEEQVRVKVDGKLRTLDLLNDGDLLPIQ